MELKYTFKSLVWLEDKGVSLTSMHEFKLKDLESMVTAGLLSSDVKANADKADEYIDAFLVEHTIPELVEHITESLVKAFGKPDPRPAQ
jgi:hypothetical protein